MSYQRRMIHFAPRTVSQTATNSPVSTMTASWPPTSELIGAISIAEVLNYLCRRLLLFAPSNALEPFWICPPPAPTVLLGRGVIVQLG